MVMPAPFWLGHYFSYPRVNYHVVMGTEDFIHFIT